MWDRVRSFVMLLALASLVAAGPLQYACASADPMPMPAACLAAMGADSTPDRAPDDGKAKACTLLQCRATPPGAERLAAGGAYVVHAWQVHRYAALPDHGLIVASRSPELRPPIA